MSRHAAARLLLAGVVAVTLLLGLGTVGQAAYTAHQPAAVATMAVLIGLFAVAVVVWARAEPTVRAPELDVTTVFGAVGMVWPDGSLADITEPVLFTHEFTSAIDAAIAQWEPGTGPTVAEINCVRGHLGLPDLVSSAHDEDGARTHVRDLLRREGFDGGLNW